MSDYIEVIAIVEGKTEEIFINIRWMVKKN